MERSEFEKMARTWREKALSTCKRYGAGQEEAEDIAQDVMLRLWQMHDELERYRSVEAIATLMAKHLLRNHQRRQPKSTRAVGNEGRRGMAEPETQTDAHHATHLIISTAGGT